jgi:magnesium chelatase subunit H
VRPAPGGDLLRTPAVLPTGRNLHGFDPFRIPSAYAVRDGARQAQRLLDRHMRDGNALPESWPWCCGAPTTSRPKAPRSPRPWR